MARAPDLRNSTVNGFTLPPGISTSTIWKSCHCATNTQIGELHRLINGKWFKSTRRRGCTCDATPSITVTSTWPPTGKTTQPSVSSTTPTPLLTSSTRNPTVLTTSPTRNPTVLTTPPVPPGTTETGPITPSLSGITPSLSGDTDKTTLIMGGVLGAAVAFLIIIILVIVLLYRRKARSRDDDNSKDCFDFCKKKKQPDFMNEPTYIPPEILPRPPGINAANITEPTYNINHDDSLVDYGYHIYETLPDPPVLISGPPVSHRPGTENLSPDYDRLAQPRVFLTASDPSTYSLVSTSLGLFAANNPMPHGLGVTDNRYSSYEALTDPQLPVAGNTPSGYQQLTNSDGAVTDHRTPGYDHLTGPQVLRHNNATDSYNGLSGSLSQRNARPNHYTTTTPPVIPDYLELEDPGAVEPSAPPDSLNRQSHVQSPANHTYYVLSS